uniref:Uncharacterized protein n=1 Tax=Capra hircus TaxID=9925 RepID=A0A8C2P6W3_CAPHI
MGTPGQCMRKMKEASRLTRVQSRQNLMIPEPRSLNLFTKNPPRNVPPPPAGTTRYPEEREGLRAILGALGTGQPPVMTFLPIREGGFVSVIRALL